MSVGFCRTLNAKTSHRWPLGLPTLACPCKPSLAGRSGTMSPCGLRCAIKSRRIGDKAMGCWCSTLLDFLSPAVSRSGRLGKVDSCHVAMYLGYVSRKAPPLVDQRLLLPKEGTKDKARLDKAG